LNYLRKNRNFSRGELSTEWLVPGLTQPVSVRLTPTLHVHPVLDTVLAAPRVRMDGYAARPLRTRTLLPVAPRFFPLTLSSLSAWAGPRSRPSARCAPVHRSPALSHPISALGPCAHHSPCQHETLYDIRRTHMEYLKHTVATYV
jgi:hypothetical protein